MLDNRNQDIYPIVTVSVITYNSSKYVLETLESIKAQTYPHLILQICDDCSTDKTVELCRTWIEENKERFVKTKIIVPEYNTGVAANFNRSWDACESEYIKDIAGDDMLLPYCIEDNMNFVKEHPEAVFVFSKFEIFGTTDERKKAMEDYYLKHQSFFDLSNKEQYDKLYNDGCCVPAPTVFCNIHKIREFYLRHDERIPNIEDYPKWLNALKKGIRFSFLDKCTVKYRIHEGSLSTGTFSLRFYESQRLFNFFYRYKDEFNKDYDATAYKIVNHETYICKKLIEEKEDEIERYKHSASYRLGNYLLIPLSIIKRWIKQEKR